jgi:hypothetical protein
VRRIEPGRQLGSFNVGHSHLFNEDAHAPHTTILSVRLARIAEPAAVDQGLADGGA